MDDLGIFRYRREAELSLFHLTPDEVGYRGE
jgi:hypothetical protein